MAWNEEKLEFEATVINAPPPPDPCTLVPATQARKYEVKGILHGHTKAVYHVEISPDMKYAATCGHDGLLMTWLLSKNEVHRVFRGHSGWVFQCRFHPDGKHIMSCSADKSVRLWLVQSTAQVHEFIGHTEMVSGCSFNKQGDEALSCGKDKTIIVWDVKKALQAFQGQRTHKCEKYRINGHPLNTDGHTALIMRAAFSPDGKTIISASHDTTVRVWNNDLSEGAYGKIKRIVDAHTDHALHVAFNK